MIIGSKAEVAIDFDVLPRRVGAPRMGPLCYWLGGSIIGEPGQEEFLAQSLMFFERLLITEVPSLPKYALENVQDTWKKAYDKYNVDDAIPFFGLTDEEFSSLFFIPFSCHFDNWFGIRFRNEHKEHFIWRSDTGDVTYRILEEGLFERAIRETLRVINEWPQGTK
jgi:hypothetical protein